MSLRHLYGNRPNWTTYLTYHNGTTEAFLHCGHCLSVIPSPEVRCGHCSVRLQEQKERFEHFIASKQLEGIGDIL